MRRLLLCGLFLAALVLPGQAFAYGGDYTFGGGTRRQQAEVKAALDASAFDWGVVPGRVTIHLRAGVVSRSTPGHIWLDTDLLDAGRFAWATVQDEYAHQVDFFVLDGLARARLLGSLGGRAWCYEDTRHAHHEYGCERFASTLVWAYWPSRHNAYRPRSAADESAAMDPAQFRRLVADLVGVQRLASLRR